MRKTVMIVLCCIQYFVCAGNNRISSSEKDNASDPLSMPITASTAYLSVADSTIVKSEKFQNSLPDSIIGIGAPSSEEFKKESEELKRILSENTEEARLGRLSFEMSLQYGWF